MKLKRWDVLLLVGLAAVALLLSVILLLTRQDGAQVVVSVQGRETQRFSLHDTVSYTIEGADGGTNVLQIADGAAWLEDASCPDGFCVQEGAIRYAGQSIICLPNVMPFKWPSCGINGVKALTHSSKVVSAILIQHIIQVDIGPN